MKSGTGVTEDTENRHPCQRTATFMTRGGRAPTPSAQRAAAAAFFTYRTITRARQSRQADAFRLLTRMVQQSADDLTTLLASSEAGEPRERRKVERALAAWRGSTISGYLRGDEQSYLENFRCSKLLFATHAHKSGTYAPQRFEKTFAMPAH